MTCDMYFNLMKVISNKFYLLINIIYILQIIAGLYSCNQATFLVMLLKVVQFNYITSKACLDQMLGLGRGLCIVVCMSAPVLAADLQVVVVDCHRVIVVIVW